MIGKIIRKYVSCMLLSTLMIFSLFQPTAAQASTGLSVTTDDVDTQVPTAPSDFEVAGKTATTAYFSWIPSTDNVKVTGYNLYSGTSLVATTVGKVSDGFSVYTLSKLTSNTNYKFTLKAKDAEGNLSAASNELSLTTNVLVAPTNLKSTVKTDTTVSLSWTAPTNNGVTTRYNIYKDNTLIGTTTGAKTYKVSGLKAGTAYRFTVKAKDEGGKLSPASTALSVTTNSADTQAPTAPTNLKLTAQTNKSVTLAWTASKDNVKVTGYDIYKGTTLVGSTTSKTYTVNELTANTAYRFTVKAKDAAGNISAASNVLTVTADRQAPRAPINLKSTAKTDTTVSLSWTASTDNIKVTGYDIYKGTTLVGTSTANTYKVTKLTASTTYKFTVKAKDAAGNVSAASNILSVTTNGLDTKAPTAPTNLKSTAKTDTTVSLTWTASTDNLKVTGYNIYQGTTLVGTSTSKSYKVSKLTPSTAYKFTAKAKDAVGNISAASNSLSVTTNGPDTKAPTAPTNLKVKEKTDKTISLSWSASTDNIKVTGYNIYMGKTLIGTSSSTSYKANNLAASTTYSFIVKAKDAAGNESAASTVSTK